MPNMSIRVIDAYVYRTTKNGILFLILKRAKTKMYEHIWQGVAGKIEKGEKSWETAKRELLEETGLEPIKMFIADHVSKFYEQKDDRINLVPVFGIEVNKEEVVLSDEHSDYKWVTINEALDLLVWIGQKKAIKIVHDMISSNDDRMRWSTIELWRRIIMLNIGDEAPDFTLLDGDENKVTLSNFRGQKVVLWFFPRASTPGWTNEGQGFRDEFKKFKDKNIVVLGMSADSTKKQKNFCEKQSFPFPLLSDQSTDVLKAYDAWGIKKMYGREYEGIYRITYIIDEGGKIMNTYSKVSVKTHALDILQDLDWYKLCFMELSAKVRVKYYTILLY